MKRPLLKFLPCVAVALLSASCSKDNDNIVEDNTTIKADKVAEKQVFYLKVNNESSLSKMTVAGFDGVAKTALKFEIGDKLDVSFEYTYDDETQYASLEAICTDEDGTFAVQSNGGAYENALEEMKNGEEGAASKYNVQLWWGEMLNFTVSKYYGYDNLSAMFAAAPRSASKSFTLKPVDQYCFIVFEDGSTKKVTVDGDSEPLSNSKCYIVAHGTKVTVEGESTTTITTEWGKLYYVRKQAGDASNTLKNPDPGKTNVVNW